MATATVTENIFRVSLSEKSTNRLRFLEALVAKIKNATLKAIKTAVTFARRSWDVVVRNVKSKWFGTTVAMQASTTTGYKALTGIVSSVLNFVTSNFGKIIRAVHNAIDRVGYAIANLAGIVLPKVGETLASVNMKFTDARWQVISYVQTRTTVFSTLINQAYNSSLTVKATTLVSSAIALLMLVPTFGVSAAALPVIGSLVGFATSGGLATVTSIAAVATAGAMVSIGNSSLMPLFKAKASTTVSAIKSKIAVTRYSEEDNTTILVEGANNLEEAVELAEAHAKEDIKSLEGFIRRGKRS
jgi:hypothetical protein